MAPLSEPWHGLSRLRPDRPPRRRRRALHRRHRRRRAARARRRAAARSGCGSRPRRRSRRRSWPRPTREQRGALDDMCALLRGLGHDVGGVEIPYGTTVPAFTARYLRGIADEADSMPHPERLSRRTKGFRRLGQRDRAARARPRPRRGGRQRARDRHRLRARRRADDPDVHTAPDPDRHLRGPRRAVDVQRLRALGAVLRGVQPHRPARRVGARRLHRRRLPARRAARRPPRRRGDAALARRPDRGRAAVGGPGACPL